MIYWKRAWVVNLRSDFKLWVCLLFKTLLKWVLYAGPMFGRMCAWQNRWSSRWAAYILCSRILIKSPFIKIVSWCDMFMSCEVGALCMLLENTKHSVCFSIYLAHCVCFSIYLEHCVCCCGPKELINFFNCLLWQVLSENCVEM